MSFLDRVGHNDLSHDMSSGHAGYRGVLLRDPCVYCGGTSRGLDHIEPRSAQPPKGIPNRRKRVVWSNSWENRAPACTPCDTAKGPAPLLHFLVRRRHD